MSELIILSNGHLEAAIHPLGAELWSLQDSQGQELMTDADPRWWTGHAPLLFPIVGRLADDSYRLDGTSYAMAQHGFARRRIFSGTERDAASARFRLDADAETLAIYPFSFRLEIAFQIDGLTLAVTASVSNTGDRDMPFSFGFHPAFAWPLPFGAADHRILFDEPEPAPVRRVAKGTGLIAPQSEATPVKDHILVPEPAMFEGDAIIWDQLGSRGLLWGAVGAPNLRIEFPDTPWLGVWQKPGAHYLCIEPWAGMADPLGFAGDIWEKPGMMRLPPGEERLFRLRIGIMDPINSAADMVESG